MALPPAAPAILAAAAVAGSIALAHLVVRLVRRAERRLLAERARRLAVRLRRFVPRGRGGPALRRAAREADGRVFWGALETLPAVAGPARRRALGELLERNPHVLAERRALRDDSPWRRELAARRLGLLASPGVRRALRRAMIRGPEPVTLAAAFALARMRDRAALAWVLDHPGALARRTPRALLALLRGFGRPALGPIAAALERHTADPRLERAMIETLGLGGAGASAAAIERRLGAAEVEVRVAAVRALGRLRAAGGAPALIAKLADPEWAVRSQAARTLGLLGAGDAVEPLSASLTDRAWWVRRHAAYALLALGERGVRALREAAAASPDPYARDIASEALAGGFAPRGARRGRP
ncbi:MAG TPA: HEAT repeat domain-containing protein [Candidatus Eisenbacteria bacterium]|jgi:HEAT repeat protein